MENEEFERGRTQGRMEVEKEHAKNELLIKQRIEKIEKVNDDKVKICLLLQRSGRDFNKQQIKQIQTFLDCKGDYFDIIEKI